jgi:hypothetical protein
MPPFPELFDVLRFRFPLFELLVLLFALRWLFVSILAFSVC